MQNLIIETAQAMNSIQLSMAHSIAVTDLAMETTTELAQQVVNQLMPAVPAGSIIDTYA